jgi:Leucine-rich repeat (LRR) protein/GTPase SAR1 family protein
MNRALALIEDCLVKKEPVLNLSYCGLNDRDFAITCSIGQQLSKCTHITKLILSNKEYDWNLNRTPVLTINPGHKYWDNNIYNGGDSSLPVIQGKQHMRYIDPPEYRPTLSYQADNKYILVDNNLSSIPDVVALLDNLEELVCGGDKSVKWKIKSLSPLKGLTKLKTLILSNNNIQTFNSLHWFPKLEKLDLGNNNIRHLFNLSGHNNLRALDLSHNKLTQIYEIGKFPYLEWLDLSNNGIQSMYGLNDVRFLKFLDLSRNQIARFQPFKRNVLLRDLNLSNNLIGSLSNLGDIPNVVYLFASNNRINNIYGVTDFKKLKFLDLSHNMIDHIPIGFSTLTAIYLLEISNNCIQCLSNISTLTNLKYFNAANNYINEIKEDGVSPSIEELILNNNRLSVLSIWPSMPNLKRLYAVENSIEEIIAGNNNSLSSLVLFKNRITTLDFIKECSNLIFLEVSNNRIRTFELEGFYSKLLTLTANNNNISGEISLANCPAIEDVVLYKNNIQKVSGIQGLSSLRKIDLSFNIIEDIGIWEHLPKLTYLNLTSNRLKSLDTLRVLPKLSKIDASNNLICKLPDLSLFPQLESLDLDRNKISTIEGFYRHKCLRNICLARNAITSLDEVVSLLRYEMMDLSNNPIVSAKGLWKLLKENDDVILSVDNNDRLSVFLLGSILQLRADYFDIPPQVSREDSRSIKNWFIARDQGGYISLEVRCILFGNGETGKTALSYYLRKGEFYPINNRTHGILIDTWEVKRKDWPIAFTQSIANKIAANKADIEKLDVSRDFSLHIWDFGGQEFYHATHRLFMSSDVLYLVLWDQKTDFQDETKGYFPQEYWTNNIEHYAASSSVLLVQNRADKEFSVVKDYCYKIGLYDKGNKERVSQYQLDMSLLTEAILKRVSKLPHFAMFIPLVYQNVSNALKKLKKPYISFVEYEAICQKVDDTAEKIMTDPSQRESLIKYLDNIGSVVCFRHREHMKDDLMKNYVFIDPKWLTSIIYKILRRTKYSFNLEHVKSIVSHFGLSAEVWITVMKNFGLIFEVRSEKNLNYIVPQYLSGTCGDQKALSLVLAHKVMTCSFTVSYPRFMPISNFLRLISTYGSDHLYDLYWKNGLVFFKNGKTVFIECINNIDERKIKVNVQDNDKWVAAEIFNRIVEIDPGENIEVSVDQANFVSLKKLNEKFLENDEAIEATNGKTQYMKNFAFLLNKNKSHDIGSSDKKIIRIFVSYSNKDLLLQELLVEGLTSHLSNKAEFEFDIRTDQAIDIGAEWDTAIKKNVGEADIAILLVSASFASFPNVKKEELALLLQRMKEDGCLMLPVLMRNYDFASFEHLSGLQFFQVKYRDYGFDAPIYRNKFMPFDMLGENEKTQDNQLNNYYWNLAEKIYSMVAEKFSVDA